MSHQSPSCGCDPGLGVMCSLHLKAQFGQFLTSRGVVSSRESDLPQRHDALVLALRQLLAQWREAAQVAEMLARDFADSGDGMYHRASARRRVYEECARELASRLDKEETKP
jgi:hypothetical protein